MGKQEHAKDEEDEEEDEDYVEEVMDESDEGGGGEEQEEQEQQPRLSLHKRKLVDQAFEELFGYPYGTRFAPLQKRARRSNSKQEKILVEMFGPTAAARLLATNVMAPTTTKVPKLAAVPEKKTVQQVKRFAGTEVTIETTVQEERKSVEKQQQGLDHVLDQLKGPSKISTVAKTSADWDKFKDQNELEEELKKKAEGKDAYLVKKDFLDRVDHRRFEQERDQRNQERAAKK